MKSLALLISASLLLLSQHAFAWAPKKVVGPKECAECHEREAKIWRNTQHGKSYKTLPRDKEAKKIAKKMGIRRMKKDDTCVKCHFTPKPKNGSNKYKTVAGVSCESCHGEAKEWINIHNTYGGPHITKQQETKAHRQQRWANAEKAGMRRPGNPYKLFNNCYECHTVPNEKLVNVGGHKAGSDFELVAWTNGEVLHRTWHNQGKSNNPYSIKDQRVLYVVGQNFDLEHAFRGMAKVTNSDGSYAKAMQARADKALKRLNEIEAAKSTPEVSAILMIVSETPITIGDSAKLKNAADSIAKHNKTFINIYDGSKLDALDKMLPKKADYKGKSQ